MQVGPFFGDLNGILVVLFLFESQNVYTFKHFNIIFYPLLPLRQLKPLNFLKVLFGYFLQDKLGTCQSFSLLLIDIFYNWKQSFRVVLSVTWLIGVICHVLCRVSPVSASASVCCRGAARSAAWSSGAGAGPWCIVYTVQYSTAYSTVYCTLYSVKCILLPCPQVQVQVPGVQCTVQYSLQYSVVYTVQC